MKATVGFLGTVCVVLLLWFSFGFLLPLVFDNFEQSGQWGDGFNSIGTLFTGLGFAGLVYTILLQIEERHDERANRLFETLTTQVNYIERTLKEFTFQYANNGAKKVGVDAMHEYAYYLGNYHPLGHLKAYGIVLMNVITSLNAFRDKLIEEKNKMPREYIVLLRVQHRFIVTSYLMPLAEAKVIRQQTVAPDDIGYGVFLHAKDAFKKHQDMLYEDEYRIS